MRQSLYTENTVQCVRYCGERRKRRAEQIHRQVKRCAGREDAGMHNAGEVKM